MKTLRATHQGHPSIIKLFLSSECNIYYHSKSIQLRINIKAIVFIIPNYPTSISSQFSLFEIAICCRSCSLAKPLKSEKVEWLLGALHSEKRSS